MGGPTLELVPGAPGSVSCLRALEESLECSVCSGRGITLLLLACGLAVVSGKQDR